MSWVKYAFKYKKSWVKYAFKIDFTYILWDYENNK